MRDVLAGVAVVTLLAVVAMASGRIVSTLDADAPRHPARETVQLHVEVAAFGVAIAFTRCA